MTYINRKTEHELSFTKVCSSFDGRTVKGYSSGLLPEQANNDETFVEKIAREDKFSFRERAGFTGYDIPRSIIIVR